MLAPVAFAGNDPKEVAEANPAPAANDAEVHWLTITQAQAAMKKQPKKVWIDVYTSWCGWCKVMDKKTYTNPNVIAYLNENFYAIRLDAETQDSITFNGKKYGFVPGGQKGNNQLAVELLQGNMMFPSCVFMQENFQNAMPPMGGYLDVPTIEVILTYLGKEKYKMMAFDQYQKEYVPSWSSGTN